MNNPFLGDGSNNPDNADDLVYGFHAAKPTGKMLEDETGLYYEVSFIRGITQYARFCFTFPLVSAPSKEWMQKYSNSIMLWCTFEAGFPERAIIVGFWFLEGKEHDIEDFPNSHTLITEKFKQQINDAQGTFKISQVKESDPQSLEISDDAVTATTKKLLLGDSTAQEAAMLGNKFATLFKAFIDDVGKLNSIATPAGPSGTISSSPLFAALATKYKTDIDQALSTIVKITK